MEYDGKKHQRESIVFSRSEKFSRITRFGPEFKNKSSVVMKLITMMSHTRSRVTHPSRYTCLHTVCVIYIHTSRRKSKTPMHMRMKTTKRERMG